MKEKIGRAQVLAAAAVLRKYKEEMSSGGKCGTGRK